MRRATDCAGPKKQETSPSSAITTQIWWTSPTSTSAAAISARIRSLAIITRFTGQRSTSTPATGAMKEKGARYATVAMATSTALPCSRKVIRLITPKSAMKSPKTLTNWASQSVRNGGWAKTARRLDLSGGTREAIPRAGVAGPGYSWRRSLALLR